MDKVELKKNMKEKLIFLYGEKRGNDTCKRLVQLIDKYIDKMPKKNSNFPIKMLFLLPTETDF